MKYVSGKLLGGCHRDNSRVVVPLESVYSWTVVEKLESIIKAARQLAQEISVIDYNSAA